MTRKIKIIASATHHLSADYYGDYYDSVTVLYPAAGDWEEVTDKEYQEYQEAVMYANMKAREKHYVLIEYSDSITPDVFKSAKEFKEKQKRDKEREEQKKAEAKKKREESALKRKQKQLEKLKRELGEE